MRSFFIKNNVMVDIQTTRSRRVRVRFAPSPTGPLHIGGVRTALYNYLFARKNGGDFILRIEDTDTTRFVPGAEQYIIESFRWLGIEFDEGVSVGGTRGPYRQSERRDIYKKCVKTLIDSGKAYVAFDTPQELEARRIDTPNFQYDSTTRMSMRNSLTMGLDEVDNLMESGARYVVRMLVEPGRDILVNDIVRGEVIVNSSVLDDKVLYKSVDEMPTYHLANIVDDHYMEISHVIRGEEWLPSAPLHVLLYDAFGWSDTMPKFAHLPLLLKPEGSGKLSKRDGDRLGFPVFPLEWKEADGGDIWPGYREKGYLPEALLNFLALLGWNPGNDQELMSIDEMVLLFSLEKCGKSGARFNYQKLDWFNREYIIRKPDSEIAALFAPIIARHGVDVSFESIITVVGVMKERVSFVNELWDVCKFFFVPPLEYDDKSLRKWWKDETAERVSELCDFLESQESFESLDLEPAVMDWISAKGYAVGKVVNALRVALVGAAVGPGLFLITQFLGKKETLSRARRALVQLS